MSPRDTLISVANVRSDYSQNVKKIIWGQRRRKRLGNILSVAMDERKPNMLSFKLFCPCLINSEQTVILFLTRICDPVNNIASYSL